MHMCNLEEKLSVLQSLSYPSHESKQWVWSEKYEKTLKHLLIFCFKTITFSSRKKYCFMQDLILQSNICLVLTSFSLRCLHREVIR